MDFSRFDTWILLAFALWAIAAITAVWIGRMHRRMDGYRKEIARLRKRCNHLEQKLARSESRAQTEIHLRDEVIDDLDRRVEKKIALLRQKWRTARAEV